MQPLGLDLASAESFSQLRTAESSRNIKDAKHLADVNTLARRVGWSRERRTLMRLSGSPTQHE